MKPKLLKIDISELKSKSSCAQVKFVGMPCTDDDKIASADLTQILGAIQHEFQINRTLTFAFANGVVGIKGNQTNLVKFSTVTSAQVGVRL